jgi:hypothetical protein
MGIIHRFAVGRGNVSGLGVGVLADSKSAE